MTIIIGTLCRDGVVIGSDGMASLNLGMTNFVGLNNLKTRIINNSVIVSSAGRDDVTNDFNRYLELNFESIASRYEDPVDFAQEICSGFWRKIFENYAKYPPQVAQLLSQTPLPNGQMSIKNIGISSLLAFYLKDKFYLFCLDENNNFYPQIVTENGLWYRILGSGFLVGNPSMLLIKKMLNIDATPSVEDAKLLVYWTIAHSIEASSGGIGGKISIAVLKKEQDSIKCYFDENLEEQKTAIDSVYRHIWQFQKKETPTLKIPDFEH